MWTNPGTRGDGEGEGGECIPVIDGWQCPARIDEEVSERKVTLTSKWPCGCRWTGQLHRRRHFCGFKSRKKGVTIAKLSRIRRMPLYQTQISSTEARWTCNLATSIEKQHINWVMYFRICHPARAQMPACYHFNFYHESGKSIPRLAFIQKWGTVSWMGSLEKVKILVSFTKNAIKVIGIAAVPWYCRFTWTSCRESAVVALFVWFLEQPGFLRNAKYKMN